MKEKLIAFERLLNIMDDLREKCPWDKKQTIASLSHLTIEETYELVDAIIEEDMDGLKKELGDVLLHIVFYARIASETNDFDIADVINALCEKLIVRHPHIYGDVTAENEQQVKENWEKIKLKEKGNTSVLSGVPKSLPALVKSLRIQDKVKGVGFDWETPEQVWKKVEEEMGELKEEVAKQDKQKMESEFGDVLFSLINYARFIGVDPEAALEKTNKKFTKRFQHMEDDINAEGKQLSEMSLEEMEKYYNKAKELKG